MAEGRTTTNDLELLRISGKIKSMNIINMIIVYVLAIGIFQFIAGLFGAETSLQVPALLMIYAGVVIIFVPLLSSPPVKIFNQITTPGVFITLLVITLFLLLTPLVAPGVIPKVFSVFP